MKFINKKGFTLIELLVVISLIGVLAVAVLSAINPIEQLNKGRDAGRRADAAQIIKAIDRYYASYEAYP
ncbi:type II secretion system GspH family protein, partial [Patescibacteria group bacterium]|nr:type II secretion system GspH family protein [Patescibacteria group bacterium]